MTENENVWTGTGYVMRTDGYHAAEFDIDARHHLHEPGVGSEVRTANAEPQRRRIAVEPNFVEVEVEASALELPSWSESPVRAFLEPSDQR